MLDLLQELRLLRRKAIASPTTDSIADRLDAKVSSRMGSIKSIQRGTISLSSTVASAIATITAVDTAKALLTYLGTRAGAGSGNGGAEWAVTLALTNATTITAQRDGPNGIAIVVSYQVVEFN